MGRIASGEVSFDDFEELDVDEIIVVVVAAVVFLLDVVGAPVVSLLVMFEAPPWENKSEAEKTINNFITRESISFWLGMAF